MESNFPGWERILSRYNVRVVPSSEQGPTPPLYPPFLCLLASMEAGGPWEINPPSAPIALRSDASVHIYPPHLWIMMPVITSERKFPCRQ